MAVRSSWCKRLHQIINLPLGRSAINKYVTSVQPVIRSESLADVRWKRLFLAVPRFCNPEYEGGINEKKYNYCHDCGNPILRTSAA